MQKQELLKVFEDVMNSDLMKANVDPDTIDFIKTIAEDEIMENPVQRGSDREWIIIDQSYMEH